MFDDRDELLSKIRLGEDSRLERKAVRVAGKRVSAPHRDGLADELAAFANGKGGVCLLGVDDKSRSVVGIPIEQLDIVEEFLHGICNDSIDPPLTADIERIMLPAAAGEDRAVVKIDVPRSLFVHRSPGGYLRRLGSSRRQLRPELLARLFQERSQTGLIRFDEQVIAGATLTDLDARLWRRFRTGRSRDKREHFLAKLGLARKDEDGVWRPTVTGVLVASRTPERWLPNAYVQAVAYRGDDVVPEGPRDFYQLDAKDINGPVDEQIVEACRFVLRNMKVAATKSMGRRDRPQFDLTAVFEAVVNAVAHRDYSVHGSKIRLRLFSDRLELFSPGGLPNTLDINSLPYRQAARNETLASILAHCPIPEEADWLATDRRSMMERRGEGVRIVLENSERLAGRRPEYRLLDDAELMLTIYAASSTRTRRRNP